MEAVALKSSLRTKSSVGLLLLAGLLFLRLGYTVYATFFTPVPTWVVPAMIAGTYILTASLIFCERNRLHAFHVDRWALGLYIIVPLLLVPFARPALSRAMYFWVQVACVSVLALALLATRTPLPKAGKHGVTGLGIGLLAGILVGGLTGVLGHLQATSFSPVSPWAALPGTIATQFVFAASVEEPLFRGFLWGYLREAGWKDVWVWLFQAGLFWLGHLYYFGRYWYSWWGIVPIGALTLGWVAWRTRSIGASMLTHTLLNTLGQVIGFARW